MPGGLHPIFPARWSVTIVAFLGDTWQSEFGVSFWWPIVVKWMEGSQQGMLFFHICRIGTTTSALEKCQKCPYCQKSPLQMISGGFLDMNWVCVEKRGFVLGLKKKVWVAPAHLRDMWAQQWMHSKDFEKWPRVTVKWAADFNGKKVMVRCKTSLKPLDSGLLAR